MDKYIKPFKICHTFTFVKESRSILYHIDNGLIIIISYHGGIIKFEDMILTLQGTIIKPISNVCLK